MTRQTSHDVNGPDEALVPASPNRGRPLPWEQIEAGRYMPRRIRGSCRGRELG